MIIRRAYPSNEHHGCDSQRRVVPPTYSSLWHSPIWADVATVNDVTPVESTHHRSTGGSGRRAKGIPHVGIVAAWVHPCAPACGRGFPRRATRRPRAAAPRPALFPLIVGLAAVVVSIGIAVYVIVAAQRASAGRPGLPLRDRTLWWLSLVGYLLTPVVVIACYGWDAIGQRNALRANRNFVPKPAGPAPCSGSPGSRCSSARGTC